MDFMSCVFHLTCKECTLLLLGSDVELFNKYEDTLRVVAVLALYS